MRKSFVLVAAATSLFSGLLFATGAPKKDAVPRKASEFVFNMIDGPQKLLSGYRGKNIVLALMYTTCPHCQHTSELLTKIQGEYTGKNVQVLGAVFDNGAAGRLQQFKAQFAQNYPLGYSNQDSVLQFLGLPPTEPYFVPILVFIDRTGTIRSQYIGDEAFLSHQEVNIRAEIDKMLGTASAGVTRAKAAAAKPAPKS
jgi:peroxiredoxin